MADLDSIWVRHLSFYADSTTILKPGKLVLVDIGDSLGKG